MPGFSTMVPKTMEELPIILIGKKILNCVQNIYNHVIVICHKKEKDGFFFNLKQIKK